MFPKYLFLKERIKKLKHLVCLSSNITHILKIKALVIIVPKA